MSVQTAKPTASRLLPLLMTVIAALLLLGCATNYNTPYNFDITCRMPSGAASTAKRTLALAAISMQAQHWMVTEINVDKGEVYGQYRDHYIVSKATPEGKIVINRVDPSTKEIIEKSTIPGRWIKTLERAFNKFRCLSQKQLDEQLRKRNLYF